MQNAALGGTSPPLLLKITKSHSSRASPCHMVTCLFFTRVLSSDIPQPCQHLNQNSLILFFNSAKNCAFPDFRPLGHLHLILMFVLPRAPGTRPTIGWMRQKVRGPQIRIRAKRRFFGKALEKCVRHRVEVYSEGLGLFSNYYYF